MGGWVCRCVSMRVFVGVGVGECVMCCVDVYLMF